MDKIEHYSCSIRIPRANAVTHKNSFAEFREEITISDNVIMRSDGLMIHNITGPNQLWIDHIYFVDKDGVEQDQLVGGDLDSWTFSLELMAQQHQEYIKRYHLKTEEEYRTFVDRVEKLWKKYMDRRGPRPKEEMPPKRLRLHFATLTPRMKIVLYGRWGNVPEVRLVIVTFVGYGQQV